VCHEELRIGTAADLITHNMLSPFTKMNDSPHNQHMIQLALTMSMYARVYGLKIQTHSSVFRTCAVTNTTNTNTNTTTFIVIVLNSDSGSITSHVSGVKEKVF